jgi:hypothetical protein
MLSCQVKQIRVELQNKVTRIEKQLVYWRSLQRLLLPTTEDGGGWGGGRKKSIPYPPTTVEAGRGGGGYSVM